MSTDSNASSYAKAATSPLYTPPSQITASTTPISSLTSSQDHQSANLVLAPVTDLSVFREQAEQQFTEQNKKTIDTLQLFKEQLDKAKSNATAFQEVLLATQQSNNTRLTQLESSMQFTVQGITKLLEMQNASISDHPVQSNDSQDQGP